jgi:hypothetical protein
LHESEDSATTRPERSWTPLSGPPAPFEFMFVALHEMLARLRSWLGLGSWAQLQAALQDGPTPKLVVHLAGEPRQVCVARAWIVHTLALRSDCAAVVAQPTAVRGSSSSSSIYDLNPSSALHQVELALDSAAAKVSQLRDAHEWWWHQLAERDGLVLDSSYARTLSALRTPKKDVRRHRVFGGGARGYSEPCGSDSSSDEDHAVEGSSYAKAVRRSATQAVAAVQQEDSAVLPALHEQQAAMHFAPMTVVLLGRGGVGKTTLMGQLLQEQLEKRVSLDDSGNVETTHANVCVCGCASAEEEEVVIEYMSVLEVESAAKDLEEAAGALHGQCAPTAEVPAAVQALRSFAASLRDARKNLSSLLPEVPPVAGASVSPIRRLPLATSEARRRAAAQEFQRCTQRDVSSESEDASVLDIVSRVTVRLHLPILRHITLLDTPGRTPGASEDQPREQLREIAVCRALAAADCWMYILPWFHSQGIMQLEQDMQRWRAHLRPGVEGMVVLARCAEQSFEDDADDDISAVATESSDAQESLPQSSLATMSAQLLERREAIQRSLWCSSGGPEHTYAIAPAVACSHAAYAFDSFDPEDTNPEDIDEETRMMERLEYVCKLIVGQTLVATAANVGGSWLLQKMPKRHWADAIVELTGLSHVAERLGALTLRRVVRRRGGAVGGAISVQLNQLLTQHVAVDKEIDSTLHALRAWERMQMCNVQLRNGLDDLMLMLRAMGDTNQRLYWDINTKGHERLDSTRQALIDQHLLPDPGQGQLQVFVDFDAGLDADATALLSAHYATEDTEARLGVRNDFLKHVLKDAASSAHGAGFPQCPSSCRTLPVAAAGSGGGGGGGGTDASVGSTAPNTLPLLPPALQHQLLTLDHTGELRAQLDKVNQFASFVSRKSYSTHRRLIYTGQDSTFNKQALPDFLVHLQTKKGGHPEGGELEWHIEAVCYAALTHLWARYRAVVNPVVHALLDVAQQSAIEGKAQDRAERKMLQLLALASDVKRCEGDVLQTYSDCLMLDARHHIQCVPNLCVVVGA